MNVCVFGLWHLGTVTAACLAHGGHHVTGLDFDAAVIAKLKAGTAPISEPGLDALVQAGLANQRLRFSTTAAEALADAAVVWVTFDTPVDDEDRADVDWVVAQVHQLFPALAADTLVLISSQLPVGTTRRIEQAYAATCPAKPVRFAYSPENLRLGRAIDVFTQPDRVVVGVRTPADQARLAELLQPYTQHLEAMSVESAEMTKHALNAFLATSVTFINEIATLCEQVGADAKEVERGLKSEARIGPRAYLSPGGAFAGGTLARDIAFLNQLGHQRQVPTQLLTAVRESNNTHKEWARRRLRTLCGDLQGQTIAVWGLTYKPGTNTLRRSSAVELCRWLTEQGALAQAHDPAIQALPADLAGQLTLMPTPQQALVNASALVIATDWPDFRTVSADEVAAQLRQPWVLDANRFLAATLGANARLRYISVGRG